jgi:hypothetical protein
MQFSIAIDRLSKGEPPSPLARSGASAAFASWLPLQLAGTRIDKKNIAPLLSLRSALRTIGGVYTVRRIDSCKFNGREYAHADAGL